MLIARVNHFYYYDVTFFRWHSDVKRGIACFLFVNFAFLFLCVFHSKFLDFYKSLMENLILNTLDAQIVPLSLQWKPLSNSSFTLLTQPSSCLKLFHSLAITLFSPASPPVDTALFSSSCFLCLPYTPNSIAVLSQPHPLCLLSNVLVFTSN